MVTKFVLSSRFVASILTCERMFRIERNTEMKVIGCCLRIVTFVWIILTTEGVAAPVILQDPQGSITNTGNSFSIRVVASGATGYQWLKDGEVLAEETRSVLTRSASVAGDSGVYQVRVTDGSAVITSHEALISVIARIDWQETFESEPLMNGWTMGRWISSGEVVWQDGGRELRISSPLANDIGLWKSVSGLKPGTNYRFHAWAKGDAIDGGGTGANICQWNTWTRDSAPLGTFGWRRLRCVVKTDAQGVVVVACRLGFWGSTVMGSASFANLALEEMPDYGTPDRPMVRCAYLIPADRPPQLEAVPNLSRMLLQWQAWYRDEMDRNGFGPKTFCLEMAEDGITPKIHLLRLEQSASDLRAPDQWSQVIAAATQEGLPLWASGQVWLIFPETHEMLPDGSILGGVYLGSGGGSGEDGGIAMVDGTALARMKPGCLTDDRSYDGLVWPEIGPYPMRTSRTFPWFEGNTVGSVSASAQGGALHELSHGFGLWHDSRNDRNFDGNLMYNGCRGWGGNLHPAQYPNDHARLSHAAAMALNVSRYFNADRTFTDPTRPSVNINLTTVPTVVSGQARIRFSASDNSDLALALLHLGGNVIGEMRLAGRLTTKEFLTPIYEPSQSNNFRVTVYDGSGNNAYAEAALAIPAVSHRAPLPSIRVTPESAMVGEPVRFESYNSTNPEGSGSPSAQWDFDDDGVFDTNLATGDCFATFPAEGTRRIRARIVAANGMEALSTPVELRIYQPKLSLCLIDAAVDLRWPVWMEGFQLEWRDSLDAGVPWQRLSSDGVVNMDQTARASTVGRPRAFFRIAR